MTTQALIAGSGLTGYSDNCNVGVGNVSNTYVKGNSFDSIMTNKISTAKSKHAVADDFLGGKKITVKNNVAACKEKTDCKKPAHISVDGKVELNDVDLNELNECMQEYLQSENGISKEEFERVMSECGFTAIDLLKTENLQLFFTKLNGMTDFSEVLTNDSFLDSWNSLAQSVLEMQIEIEDVGIMETDTLLDALSDDEIIASLKEQAGNRTEKNSADNMQDVLFDSGAVDKKNNEDIVIETMSSGEENQGAERHVGTDSVFNEKNHNIKSAEFNESLFESFINNIQESVSGNEGFDSGRIQLIKDVAFQIIEGVKVNVKADTSSLELSLNPESLGKVNVAVEMKDGICTANFIVRNELAKAAVESQLQTLKETFEERGLKVDAVEVNVSDFSFDQNRQTFSEEKKEKSGDSKIRITRRKSMEDAVSDEKETVQDNTEQGIDLTV